MKNRKKLVKDALSIFVTLGITTISASATDALPLKENTQKGANAASNCIRNTKQKPTPLKLNLISGSDNKIPHPPSNICNYCTSINSRGNCNCERLRCSEDNDNSYYRCN